jgi:hypothetical protein
MGSCVIFQGPLVPECTRFNYVFSFKRLLSSLLSRKLTISLASFSCLDYSSITWALDPRIRVQGVDHSLCLLFFFSLIVRPLSAILPSQHFWGAYARAYGLIFTISLDLISRSTRLILRFVRVSFPLLQVSRPSPPSTDRRNGPRTFDYPTYFR